MVKYIIVALVAALIGAGAATLYGLGQNGRYLVSGKGHLLDTRTGELFLPRKDNDELGKWEEYISPLRKQ